MSGSTLTHFDRGPGTVVRLAIKWAMAVLIGLTIVLRAGAAEASHFRYGTINWAVPDPVNAPLTVRFTVTAGWAQGSEDRVTLQFGNGQMYTPPAAPPIVGSGIDSGGRRYNINEYTITHTYAAAGAYTAQFSSCCRVSGLQNGAGGSFVVQSSVAVGGTPANSAGPTSAAPAVIQMQVGATRTYSFPMFDADGDPATCRFARGTETGLTDAQSIPSVPNGGAQPTLSSAANDCIVNWNLANAVAGQQFVLHLVMESTHNGAVSSTAVDLITEMVTPPPPTCTGTATFNVSAGQLVSAPTSATWGTVGNATVSMINAPTGATLLPGGAGPSPFTNTFTWTPTLADLGTTKVVIVNYVNAQNLSCAAYITVNTAACPVCTGNTPFCDPALRVCGACTADNGGGGVRACGASNPLCTTSGACGRCASDTECTTGVAHAGPYCDVPSGACTATCSTDAQCGAGNWCNAGSCTAKLANDQPIPTVAGHSPPLNGTCDAAAATAVCASGTCEADGRCGLQNGTTVPSGSTATVVCRAAIGDADGKCGLADGSGACTAGNQAVVCRSTRCATTGASAGKCVACTADAQCSGGTAACSPVSNTCVQCTADNRAACGGTTPICDAAQSLCVPCGGDNGSSAALACSITSPLCVSNGPQAGSCGVCASRADCAGSSHAGPVCDATTGACGNTCKVDGDCASSEWCNAATCTAKLANGAPIPNVATHAPPVTGACTPPAAMAVCASGVCDTDDRCGLKNGTTVPGGASGASVCRAGVADPDGQCGLANGSGQCTTADAATQCRSGLCAVSGTNVGKCVECLGDVSCSGAQPACDSATNTCAVCTATNASACGGLTPLCNLTVKTCAACTGDSGGSTATLNCPSASPYCVPQGATAGSCTKCTSRSDCSVGTHAGLVCDTVSGSCGSACTVDAQCAATEWCNGTSCASKLLNNTTIPVVPGHSPVLNGMCTSANAAAVCASGVCDPADNRCGLPNGATVLDGAIGTQVCRAGLVDGDGKCGLANGSGSCLAANAAEVCRSAVCAITGTNAGKCVGCVNDASCSGATPSCDPGTNTCVICTESNAVSCAGATPVCNATLRSCVACASDAKMGVPNACPAATPYCVASGPQAGSCGKCTERSDCGGDHNGAVCDVATGACGTACERDSDCETITEYCTGSSGAPGVCTSKLANGAPLPEVPAAVAVCTAEVGMRVCLSSVCDSDDGRCGRLIGNDCSGLGDCRAGRCSETTGKCIVCDNDGECSAGTYCGSTGTCGTTKPDGETCSRAAECATGRCDAAGRCGSGETDGGMAGMPDGGTIPGATDAGRGGEASPRRDVTIEGGGLSCAVSSAGGERSTGVLWAVGALAAAGLRRRARRHSCAQPLTR